MPCTHWNHSGNSTYYVEYRTLTSTVCGNGLELEHDIVFMGIKGIIGKRVKKFQNQILKYPKLPHCQSYFIISYIVCH